MSSIKALLLTDVVDSTRMAEKIGDSAMAKIWAAHDRMARALLDPWRGREIDKTDGMLLLFDDAAEALEYALAYTPRWPACRHRCAPVPGCTWGRCCCARTTPATLHAAPSPWKWKGWPRRSRRA